METATKGYAVRAMGSAVTVEDLDAINRYALSPLGAEEVYVRRVQLCSDQLDREYERIPAPVLERLAETLTGKALLAAHDGTVLPNVLGRFYAAEVARRDGAAWLDCAFYMAKSPANEEVRRQIDAGVYTYASIGFLYDALLCDVCRSEYYSWDCDHIRGEIDPATGRMCSLTFGGRIAGYEAIEGSLVYLGCQYGASVMKGLDRSHSWALEKSARRGVAGRPAVKLYEVERERAALELSLLGVREEAVR